MLISIVASLVDDRFALRANVSHLPFDDVRHEIVTPVIAEFRIFSLTQRTFSQTLIHSSASRKKLFEKCYQELPDL